MQLRRRRRAEGENIQAKDSAGLAFITESGDNWRLVITSLPWHYLHLFSFFAKSMEHLNLVLICLANHLLSWIMCQSFIIILNSRNTHLVGEWWHININVALIWKEKEKKFLIKTLLLQDDFIIYTN